MIRRSSIYLGGMFLFWIGLDFFKIEFVPKICVLLVALICLFEILQGCRVWNLEKRHKFETYQLFIQMHTAYRHSQKLRDVFKCDHPLLRSAAEEAEQGLCPFKVMEQISKHYLYREMLAVIAMDTKHGVVDVHGMLHNIELNMDTWHQMIKHYQNHLEKHLRKMCILVVVALGMTKIVLNLIESVVPISLTSFYQLTMTVYLSLMALFSNHLFRVMKKGMDIDYEYVD